MANEESTFRLIHLGNVTESILAIAANARELGLTSFVKARLLAIREKLVHEPQKWGDPLYATARPGGTVFRGFLSPFVVRFAVFPDEKLVLLWDIRVLDDHPLAPR